MRICSNRACAVLLALQTFLVSGAEPGRVFGWGDAAALRMSGAWAPEVAREAVAVAPDVLTNAVSISSSSFFSLALKQDGTVFGWGSNHDGQALGRDTLDSGITNGFVSIGGLYLSNVVAVAAGTGFGMVLKADGTVASWGRTPALAKSWNRSMMREVWNPDGHRDCSRPRRRFTSGLMQGDKAGTAGAKHS